MDGRRRKTIRGLILRKKGRVEAVDPDKFVPVMDAEDNSEPGSRRCDSYGQCRCGDKGAALRAIGTAVRAVHDNASLPASITLAQAAVDGADFRSYPTLGVDP